MHPQKYFLLVICIMICKTSCAVAIVFLMGTLYTSYCKGDGLIKPYLDTLNENQKEKYEKIAEERKRISMKGYLLGFAISLFLIVYNYVSRKKISGSAMICLAVSTTLVVNYLYYILSPKSDWMVNHLETPEQKAAWLKVYRTMQFKWHAGLALGLIAVGFTAAAFKC